MVLLEPLPKGVKAPRLIKHAATYWSREFHGVTGPSPKDGCLSRRVTAPGEIHDAKKWTKTISCWDKPPTKWNSSLSAQKITMGLFEGILPKLGFEAPEKEKKGKREQLSASRLILGSALFTNVWLQTKHVFYHVGFVFPLHVSLRRDSRKALETHAQTTGGKRRVDSGPESFTDAAPAEGLGWPSTQQFRLPEAADRHGHLTIPRVPYFSRARQEPQEFLQ